MGQTCVWLLVSRTDCCSTPRRTRRASGNQNGFESVGSDIIRLSRRRSRETADFHHWGVAVTKLFETASLEKPLPHEHAGKKLFISKIADHLEESLVRPFFPRRRRIISQRRRLCKHAGSFLPPDSRAQPNLSVFIRVSWTYCSLLQRGWQQIPYCITHRAGVLVLTHTCGVDFRDPAGKSLRGSLALHNGFCCVLQFRKGSQNSRLTARLFCVEHRRRGSST